MIILKSFIVATGLLLSVFVWAKPAKLQAYWQPFNPQSQIVVNHGAWQQFLDDYVEMDELGQTYVHYAQVSLRDYKGPSRIKLDTYLTF